MNKLQIYISQDSSKISIWKRDTEKIIDLLQKRKQDLQYGEWRKYLDGVGIPKSTAHRLLSKVNETTEDVPNGTSYDVSNVQFEQPEVPENFVPFRSDTPPQETFIKEVKIEDIDHEEIAPQHESQVRFEKEFEKEHTPSDYVPKNMPDEYYWICEVLEKPDLTGYLKERKSQLEHQYNDRFPEWKEFIASYTEWFETRVGHKPNIMAKDFANAKRIIIYLRGIGEGVAINNWKAILQRWSQLDNWQQNRTDLTSIHTDLNKIISQLKNGSNKKTIESSLENLNRDRTSQIEYLESKEK